MTGTLRTTLCLLACWMWLVGTPVEAFPPTITVQPVDQTAQIGGSATFAVQATSGTTLSYQWYFLTNTIPGATNSVYTRTNSQFTDAGAYHAAVMNADGTVNSSNAVLSVVNYPVISADNNSSAVTNATTLTWSHTVGSGINRILVVGLAIHNSTRTVSSATYSGQNLTLIGEGVDGGGNVKVALYRLLAPPVGTANVSVTINSADRISGGAVSFTGVSQSAPTGTFAAAGSSGLTSSVNVSSATNEVVIDMVGATGDALTLTVGAKQLQRWNKSAGSASTDVVGASSTENGATNVTMSWTLGTSKAWAIGAVPLKPVTNSAPMLSGANNLTAIYQDDTNNSGTLVTNLIAGYATDPDPGALKGIAVTAVANTNGTWQYSTNSGSGWINFGSPSANSARLLAATASMRVRFVPNTNWNGTVANGLTFRAWDQALGTIGGTWDVTVNGGMTAFSSNTASSGITVYPPYNTVTVDTTSDVADGDTSSVAALLANKGADGKISLREAIAAANNTPNGPGGADRINFNITNALAGGAHTVNLTNALPAIVDPLLIDGTTDDSFTTLPVIQLNGAGAGAGVSGLTISNSGTTVRGLAINRFAANGLVLAGDSNTVELSCFGVGVDGTSVLSNGQAGILITGRSNTVGGQYGFGQGALSQFNVIGGNTGAGILISGTNATGNAVIGNYIGVSTDGATTLPNAYGVRLDTGAVTNRIGGTGSGDANQIAANLGDGISVVGTNTTGNAFLANVIRANGGLGIDLNDDGVTLNDLGDGDTGPNRRQNFPVLSSASFDSTSLTVAGSLNSIISTAFRLEFFRVSPAGADPSGYGEAESFVGSVAVATDGSGNATFNATFPGVLMNAGDKVTATAVRNLGGGLYGDTSEFSQNVNATNLGTPGFSISALAPVALGSEIRANTSTASDQYWYFWSIRAVAVAPDGSFVGVWIDTGAADGNKKGILGQRFDVNGNKVGGEFIVNTTRTGDQDDLSLAMDTAGNFIVLWDSTGDGSGTGIYGQRFLADGTRVGGEFLLNTTTAGSQVYPEVAFATNGSFVAAWKGPNPYGSGSGTIAQRFDANANKVGGEILVNAFSGKDQIIDSMDVRPDGSFIVTWGESGDVFARIFDPNGSAVTAVFQLNTTISGTQEYSTARADAAGNFVVVWQSASQDGSGNGVFGRRFASDGTPLTGEFALTTQTAGDQYGPSLAMDQFGNFVAAWGDANGLDGSGDSVWVQRFTANGTRVGAPQRANTTTSGFQGWPVMAMNRAGNLVVGWEGTGTGDSYGAFLRRFQVTPILTEGSSTNFTVALTTAPSAPVTLNLSVSDPGEASLSVSSLIFSPTNWSVPQTVTVTALQDGVLDGDQALTIITSPAVSSDASYNDLNPDDIPMVTLDSGITVLTADVVATVTGPTNVFASSTFSYTLLVTNSGPDAAGGLSVADTLPAGVVFVPASSTAGAVLSGGVVTWTNLGTLSAGASMALTLTVTAPASGSLSNLVSSAAVTSDPVLSNNNGSAAGAKAVTLISSLSGPAVQSVQFVPNSGYQVGFVTLSNTMVSIEASTDLVAWLSLVTTNSGTGVVVFVDQSAAGYLSRFYRMRQLP